MYTFLHDIVKQDMTFIRYASYHQNARVLDYVSLTRFEND